MIEKSVTDPLDGLRMLDSAYPENASSSLCFFAKNYRLTPARRLESCSKPRSTSGGEGEHKSCWWQHCTLAASFADDIFQVSKLSPEKVPSRTRNLRFISTSASLSARSPREDRGSGEG